MKKTVEDICSEVEKNNKSYTPMAPELTQTSSFYYDSYEEFIKRSEDEKNNFVYTRGSNPTTSQLEEKLARLEQGEKCKIFSSGMGAIAATLFSLLKSGDHILMINTIYGEAVSLSNYMQKFGIEQERIDVSQTEDITDYIRNNTKMIYFESPSSQKFELLDLEEIARIAEEKDIITAIDATWASPIFQNPLKYGIDLVVHSLSKYIGGHSDIVGGAVIGKDEIVDYIFEKGHQSLGAVISPFNSWLGLRGLRTLPIRMNYLNNSVKKVIDFLSSDPRISKVFHPYCGNSEQQFLTKKYLSGFGSLLAIELKNNDFDKLKQFINTLELISIGVSWGGFESLVLPAYKGNNEVSLKERGLSLSHIRMYVGLENPESIIQDIKNALDLVYK